MSSIDEDGNNLDPKRTLYNLRVFLNHLCPPFLILKSEESKSSYNYDYDNDEEDGDSIIQLKEKLKILKRCYSTEESIDVLNKFALTPEYCVLLVECFENDGITLFIYLCRI